MKKIKLNLLWAYIILVFTAIAGSYAGYLLISYVEKNPKSHLQTSPTPTIQVPTISKQDIKNAQYNFQNLPEYQFSTPLLSSEISTPSFVTDPEKLKNYLSETSVEIKITGTIKSAYLSVQTENIDIRKESVYVFIVDGSSIGGHLNPTESLIPDKGVTFLYNLSKLPLMDLPYSLDKQSRENNVLKMLNNKNDDRIFYIGGFVSTTDLPNQITKMEILYSCEDNDPCEIFIQ